jgi:hypothetical protein
MCHSVQAVYETVSVFYILFRTDYIFSSCLISLFLLRSSLVQILSVYIVFVSVFTGPPYSRASNAATL